MANNPLLLWIGISLVELIVSMAVMGYTVLVQIQQFRYKSKLQPLKWWLLNAMVALIIFNLPIINIYFAAILHLQAATWETALAIVANATGHLVFAIFILLVYRFRGVD